MSKIALFQITLTAMLVTTSLVFGQRKSEVQEALKSIETMAHVDSLKQVNREWSIFKDALSSSDTLNFPFLKNPILGVIFKSDPAFKERNHYLAKIVKEEEVKMCRVQSIYLDLDMFNEEELDSLIAHIKSRHLGGEKFTDLFTQYNMDSSPCDMGWFSEGMVLPAFFRKVLTKSKGDVFDVILPENGMESRSVNKSSIFLNDIVLWVAL
jgi:hypothetical protein